MKKTIFMLLLAFSTLTANAQVFQTNSVHTDYDIYTSSTNDVIGSLGTIDLTPANRVNHFYKTTLYNLTNVDFNASIEGPGAPHWGQIYGNSAEITFLERLAIELDYDNGSYPLTGSIYIPSTLWYDRWGNPQAYDPMSANNLQRGYYILYIHLWNEGF